MKLKSATMGNVFFQPFVGRDYLSGGIFGRRVMALGESHYCGERCANCGVPGKAGDCVAFTSGVIERYLDPKAEREPWMNTYLKFERSLVGHETDQAERERIWRSLLFFNYLQVAMDETRKAGTHEQYQRAQKAFYETLDQYRPESVIVWGKRLWEYLPGDERWRAEEDLVVDGEHVATGSYALDNGQRARVTAVYHPSAGYSWDWWHKVITRFLNLK